MEEEIDTIQRLESLLKEYGVVNENDGEVNSTPILVFKVFLHPLIQVELQKLRKLDVSFDESYQRGVHENWGGRAIQTYESLKSILEILKPILDYE